jgi:ABC-type sugar transport system ATPase subunit
MAGIEIRGLSKRFRDSPRALDSVDLDVDDGELLVLVGPSGSGKTTLLRLIAGLDQPTAGTVRLSGSDLAGVPPHRRNVALVFQNLALYSHLSVADNLAFGQENNSKAESGKRKAESRVQETARLLGIEHLLERYPAELSGGEQQRVALGRAIVRQPAALLLDEPLSSLDGPARRGLRRELKALVRRLGVPTIYVTHDQAEALALGDKIAVLDLGRAQQVGTPGEVYHRPANRFVAEFFGPQGMNLIEGKLKHEGEHTTFCGAGTTFDVTDIAARQSGRVQGGFRPDDVQPATNGELHGLVESVESLGEATYLHVRLSGEPHSIVVVRRLQDEDQLPSPGAAIALTIAQDRFHWFDPTTGNRLET